MFGSKVTLDLSCENVASLLDSVLVKSVIKSFFFGRGLSSSSSPNISSVCSSDNPYFDRFLLAFVAAAVVVSFSDHSMST